jgi:hypothetical protein
MKNDEAAWHRVAKRKRQGFAVSPDAVEKRQIDRVPPALMICLATELGCGMR